MALLSFLYALVMQQHAGGTIHIPAVGLYYSTDSNEGEKEDSEINNAVS